MGITKIKKVVKLLNYEQVFVSQNPPTHTFENSIKTKNAKRT